MPQFHEEIEPKLHPQHGRFVSKGSDALESSTLEDLLGFKLSESKRKYAPERLYYKGDPKLLQSEPRVSVVGTRKASPEGISETEEITRSLVEKGVVVVSGLAQGIDTAAHKSAIKSGGRTIAVLGTPVDQYSSAANRQLQDFIGDKHLLVTQFGPGSRTGRWCFPSRNRTMALLSHATIIVEISGSSGTEHQGWEAIRLGHQLALSQSVIEDKTVSWPRKMVEYGAVVLGRDLDINQLIMELPILG